MGRSTIFVFVPNNWMKEVWDRALCFLPLFFFLRFLELGWKGCDERSLPFISGVAWKIVRNDCLAKSSGSVSKSARFGPLPSLPPLFFILFFSFFCFFSFFLIISSRSWQLLRATKRAGEQLLRVFFSVVVAVISIARARSFPSRIENGISRAVSEGWRSYVRCVVFFFFFTVAVCRKIPTVACICPTGNEFGNPFILRDKSEKQGVLFNFTKFPRGFGIKVMSF